VSGRVPDEERPPLLAAGRPSREQELLPLRATAQTTDELAVQLGPSVKTTSNPLTALRRRGPVDYRIGYGRAAVWQRRADSLAR
jgi:hypothetical protein